MTAITDTELAAARADLATMLPDLCTIQRAVDTSDGGGGQSTTWPDLAADVPCRLTPAIAARAGAGTALAGERLNDTATHIVTFAADTDVQIGDRITVDTTAYEALVVGNGGAWELSRHVQVRPVA